MEVLHSNQIISDEMLDLCSSNRILLSSVSNRGQEIVQLLHFMVLMKADPHDVPNKVRQLAQISDNIVKRKLNLHQVQQEIKKVLYSSKLGNCTNITKVREHNKSLSLVEKLNSEGINLRDIVSEIEISAIRYAHSKVGNSQNKISNFLGISRGSLQNKLKKYALDYDDWLD